MVGYRRLPSLPSIRAFEAAARLGGFAPAARELDTTAASVSYHVRRLEQQVGVRLFRRHPQRVELTRAGRLVAQEASNAFAALSACFIKAAETDEACLSLTALPSMGTSWLTPRLGGFRRLHPQITVELDLSADAQDLVDGPFDAAIRNGHGDWAGLRAQELFPSIFMPLCAPQLLEVARSIDDPASPMPLPLLGRPEWWRCWYRARGLHEVKLDGRFGTSLSAEYLDIAAAVAGHGVAIGSPILFRDELEAGRLVPVHDFVAADGRRFWFVYPLARHDSHKIAAFRDWLLDQAAGVMREARGYVRRAVVAAVD